MFKNKTQQTRATFGALPAMTAGLLAVGALTAQASTDYGPAIWRSACSGHWSTSGNGHKFLVIHDMEGYYAYEVSASGGLRSCSTTVSVHYGVNGKKDATSDYAPGEITQFVSEANYAWHAKCWNSSSAGTEHEGFRSNPAWYTPELYQNSALLQRHMADHYGIAKDRNHIVGHDAKSSAAWVSYANSNLGINASCNTHDDPGPYWDWTGFMALINPPPAQPSLIYSRAGDFNGDGKKDVLVLDGAKAWVNVSTGTNFPTGTAWNNNIVNPAGTVSLVGDFNGDGKDDLLFLTRGTDKKAWVNLSTGSSFPVGTVWGTGMCPGTTVPLTGDFNGDGKDDVVIFDSGKAWVNLSTGSSFAGGTVWNPDINPAAGSLYLVGDFNGDGKDDLLFLIRGTDQRAWVNLSTGTSFAVGTVWGTSMCPGTDWALPGDFNGDGKTDLVVFDSGKAWVNISTGSSFPVGTVWNNNTPIGASALVGVGNFDGTSKDSLIFFDRGSVPKCWVNPSTGSAFLNGTVWNSYIAPGTQLPLPSLSLY